MLSNISKALVALAAVATVAALPAGHPDAATCKFVLHPEVPVNADTTNLLLEFNAAIVDALIVQSPINQTWSGNSTWIEKGDNFDVKQTIAAIGLTRAQSATIMNGWVGTTLPSVVTSWFVKSAHCA
ncbi:hypothetical protein BDZ94DRAFT_1265572 [Collybia nuda]|uniref:Uncharacterized protein n=1 Tax=Collybia nuda TaxID=64659 RepID=A0A9P6CH90_9AGAR|nr:hypothetical protein BDZ94DRAFT_1265572 [Collybia nuda]